MIPKTYEEAFSQIKPLVEKFQQTEAHYLSPKYQEAEVRQEFLDKFLSRSVGMFITTSNRILTNAKSESRKA